MKKLRIAIAGLGVVGCSIYDILKKDAALIAKRCRRSIEITALASRSKKDFVEQSKIPFTTDILQLASNDNVDVVIEAIGGTTIAKDLAQLSLKNGKHYITSNKALIAEHGVELARLAEENNVQLLFESAVGGAIPIIKTFKEGLAANKIEEFYAILNGTCNYILTKMYEEKMSFDAALKQAQALGYAEADPTFDVKGIDTAHKLTILAAIASMSEPNFSAIETTGIDQISIDDIALADELGYKIKLLAIYKDLGNHKIAQAVYPALVSKNGRIANVDDSFNTILTKTSNAEWNFVVGRGAGGFPTASAVIADIVDLANDHNSFAFGVCQKDLTKCSVIPLEQRIGSYFVKLILKQNLQSDLNEILGKSNPIAIKSSICNGINCAFVVENIAEKSLISALQNLDKNIVANYGLLRIEQI